MSGYQIVFFLARLKAIGKLIFDIPTPKTVNTFRYSLPYLLSMVQYNFIGSSRLSSFFAKILLDWFFERFFDTWKCAKNFFGCFRLFLASAYANHHLRQKLSVWVIQSELNSDSIVTSHRKKLTSMALSRWNRRFEKTSEIHKNLKIVTVSLKFILNQSDEKFDETGILGLSDPFFR